MNFVIKKTVLNKINTPKMRKPIADAIGCTENAVYKLMKENQPNGTLTTLASLHAIADLMDKEEIHQVVQEVK